MFIIYNHDGSVKQTNFAEFIQKNNDNVNHIFVTVIGKEINEYNVYASFLLPNHQLGGPIIGELAEQLINGVRYVGYSIPITNEVTAYDGVVQMSIYVADENTTLYTYPVKLTVNDAASAPNETKINITQYQQLLNALNSISVDTSALTVLDDISVANIVGYPVGHLFYDKATQLVYKKTLSSYEYYEFFQICTEQEAYDILEGGE